MPDPDQEALAEQLSNLGFSTDISIPARSGESIHVHYKGLSIGSQFYSDDLSKTSNKLEQKLSDIGVDQKTARLFITFFIQKYLDSKKSSQDNVIEGDQNKKISKEVYVQRYHLAETVLEAVLIDGHPFFLVARKSQHDISIQQSLEFNDKILRPLENDAYLSKPYSFSSEDQLRALIEKVKQENLDTLFNRTKSIWMKYIDADNFHITSCAADTIFTYFQDKLGLTHYLFFVGDNSSGKSNNLTLLHVVSYRNFMTTGLTAANVYQFLGGIEEGQGTLCIDEADQIDEDPDLMRICKNGYTTGFPVTRIDTSNGRRQLRFFTFGFKAFSAERLPDSITAKGFKQRVIPIPCSYGTPQYDISEVLNPAGEQEYEDLIQELNQLRNELLLYRLLHYHEKIPNLKINLTGREKQLFKPLIRLFQNTKTLNEILPIISKHISERREDNANSFNAFLYRTSKYLIKQQNSLELESALIWETVSNSLPGQKIQGKTLTYESSDFGTISQKRVIETLMHNFGAKQSSHRRDKRKLVFDKTKLERLGKIYEQSIEIKVGTSVTDVTDVTDVGLDKHVEEQSNDNETVNSKQETNNIDNKDAENHTKNTYREEQQCVQLSINPSQASHPSPEKQGGLEREAGQEPNNSQDQSKTPFDFSCYYCGIFRANLESEYLRHNILKHPGKPAYPSKIDLEKMGLEPKGKTWEA